jgi:integrase
MPLSDAQIRKIKADLKPRKFFDADGLFLLVQPTGRKWWRFKYRFGGKEKLLSVGTYPETSLKDARSRRDRARELVQAKIDPSALRRDNKAALERRTADAFETVAREWIAQQTPRWVDTHRSRIELRLRNDVFPWIGTRPIADLLPADILQLLKRVEARGAIASAHRIQYSIGQIFRYAVATGRVERNPIADLRGALKLPQVKHRAAITKPGEVGALLRALETYKGTLVTRCALLLAPLLFVRPGELRQAEWSEIDLASASWDIPASRMKLRKAHLVPLATQALAILAELKPLTGAHRYVFPSPRDRDRPMSNNAILSALRRLDYGKDEMSGHGFRAMARTILDEVLNVPVDLIEHQLAHRVKDPNGRAYNRTAHLPARRKMMQQWADYLDDLKAQTDVNTTPATKT